MVYLPWVSSHFALLCLPFFNCFGLILYLVLIKPIQPRADDIHFDEPGGVRKIRLFSHSGIPDSRGTLARKVRGAGAMNLGLGVRQGETYWDNGVSANQ